MLVNDNFVYCSDSDIILQLKYAYNLSTKQFFKLRVLVEVRDHWHNYVSSFTNTLSCNLDSSVFPAHYAEL